MWKLLRRSLLALVLGTIAVLSWITLSPTGTRWALQSAAAQLDALSIGTVEGRLYDGFSLSHLHYLSGDTRVDATQLHTAWAPACLLQKKLCLDDISLETLALELPPSTDTPATKPTDAPFSIPELPLEIALTRAQIGTLSWRQGESKQSLSDISLSLDALRDAISIHSAALRWQDNQLRLTGQLKLQAQYPLDATLQLRADTLLGPQPSELTLHARGQLDGQLALDAQLSGHQQATLLATVSALQTPIALQGRLDGQLLQSPEPEPQAQVENLSLDFSGDLQQLELKSELKLSGTQLPDTQLALSATLLNSAELQALTLRANTLGGVIELAGDVGWQPQLRWQLAGQFDDLDPSTLEPSVSGMLGGTLNTAGEQRQGEFISPRSTLNLSGTLQGRPLRAELDASLAAQGMLTLRSLDLHSGDNHLNASGSIAKTVDLDGQLDAADLSTLWPGLGGKLQGRFAASGPREKPDLRAQLQGDALQFNEFGATTLGLDANILEGGAKPSKLTLSSDGIAAPGLADATVQLQLDGSLKQHQVALQAGTAEQSVDLQLTGALDGADWSGSLETAKLAQQHIALNLQQATAIAWRAASAQASIAAHCWQHAEASLCLREDALVSAESGAIKLSLQQLTLAELDPLLPSNTQLRGTLNSDISGAWRAGSSPTVDIDSAIDGLSLRTIDPDGNTVAVDFQQALLKAQLIDTQGDLELLLDSREQGKTQLTAQLDPNSQKLQGRLDMQGFLLEPLKPLLPMLDELKGTLSASGDLSGTLDDPRFDGSVVLADPAVAGVELPLTVDGGKLQIDIRGRRATLDSSIDIAPRGTLKLSGDINYQDALSANLQLQGEQLALLMPPSIDATVNHDIAIVLDADTLKIRGDVRIPKASIVLEGMTGSGPSLSKDMVLIDEEELPEQSAEAAPAIEADVDVRVRVDEQVQLTGYGFDTYLIGDIKVRQRPGQPPQLAGELRLKDGQYQAYGQDLVVRRGELLFVGPVRATRIDVNAVRVVEDVEAGLLLEGELLTPKATLYSEPSMADADILSYIVLGGPPGQGGGDEGAMLARAALGLGLKNGNRIASQFASAAGIQDFNIGADGKGDDTAVVLSGRVSPNLLLSYRMGIFDAVNTLTARYDLSKALYLELVRGTAQAIDVFYTFDY